MIATPPRLPGDRQRLPTVNLGLEESADQGYKIGLGPG